jgi:hypothetical protein
MDVVLYVVISSIVITILVSLCFLAIVRIAEKWVDSHENTIKKIAHIFKKINAFF